MAILFEKTTLGSLPLQNHLVMSPMTRNRAIDNIPNDLMATYYGQRASAGLIITEGTSPSPNGLGYPRIPGIFSLSQVAGWQRACGRGEDFYSADAYRPDFTPAESAGGGAGTGAVGSGGKRADVYRCRGAPAVTGAEADDAGGYQ